MYFTKFFGRVKLGIHKETIPFFLASLFGNLLPLIFGLLFYARGSHQWEGWFKFYGNGEFYIYNAGFLTAAGYLFFSFKEKNYDIFSILFYISSAIAIVDSLLYVFLISDKTPPDISFLRWTSGVFFFSALVLFYIANYLNYKIINVLTAEREGINKIKNQLPQ
jgi:hypothetical protein